MLDAAFPPSPQQWVADMNAVGAGGGFVYAWGPFTNYTSTHVSYAESQNKIVVPIIVPGNTPGDVQPMLSTAHLYGFVPGPIVFDLEPTSEPPPQWVDSAFSVSKSLGWLPEEYGTASVLGTYSPGSSEWIADWIRTGVLDPIPQLPAGWLAWQFVNDVNINGHQYDVSVIDPVFVQGTAGSDILTQGGNVVGLSYRPGGPNWRLDMAFVANDGSGNVMHCWSSGAPMTQGACENLGGVADPRFGAQCTWDAQGAAITFQCVGVDGNIYQQVLMGGLSGEPRTGWVAVHDANNTLMRPQQPIAVGPAGPAGPAGAPGPTYDDSAVKAAIEAIKTELSNVKAALN